MIRVTPVRISMGASPPKRSCRSTTGAIVVVGGGVGAIVIGGANLPLRWIGAADILFSTFRISSWRSTIEPSISLRTGIWKFELTPSGNFFWRTIRSAISARLTIRHPTMPYMRVKIGRFSGSPRWESFNFLPLESRLFLEEANEDRIVNTPQSGARVNDSQNQRNVC